MYRKPPPAPDELDLLADGESLDLLGTTGFVGDSETVFENNGAYSLLNFIEYVITVASDQDGLYDEIVTTPKQASEQAGGILWVLLTSGFFHRVRFEAIEPEQYYHVRLLEATMYYQGQLS